MGENLAYKEVSFNRQRLHGLVSSAVIRAAETIVLDAKSRCTPED